MAESNDTQSLFKRLASIRSALELSRQDLERVHGDMSTDDDDQDIHKQIGNAFGLLDQTIDLLIPDSDHVDQVLGGAKLVPVYEDPRHRDDTAARIIAFVDSIRPLAGTVWAEDVQEGIDNGRSLILKLALSANGSDPYDPPTMKLSPAECADILTFLSCSEAKDRAGWWKDGDQISHICGYNFVLDAMADSLRGAPRNQRASVKKRTPEARP